MAILGVPRADPDRPWVSGLKRPDEEVGTDRESWKRRVELVLLRRFAEGDSRGATAESERGLGLNASVYAYVFRTEPRFGYVVFLWGLNAKEPLRDSDGSVAPFDTGGIWHEHVVMNPPLTPAARKTFVAAHSRPVAAWRTELTTWLSRNYDDPADYVTGAVPRFGVPGIVYDGKHEPAAWTWEARLEKGSFRHQVLVRSVFWSGATRRAFEDWLETADMDERDAVELLRLSAALSVETPATELADEAVRRHLVRIIDDER